MDIINILAVDDDPNMLKIHSKSLEAGGYTVTVAERGEEALKLLKSFTPELIIADVMMPEMNGYELCREVRSMGNEDIPFIFCSALGKLPERIKGLWIGADDYIVKPVNATELLLKVDKLIKKSRKLREMASTAQETAAQGIMSGTLENIKVGELLQILNFIGLSQLCFQIVTTENLKGEIFIEKNKLIHAHYGEFSGMKAFCRILGWKKGTYKVEKKKCPLESNISGQLEECLFEGATQLDEYNMLRDAFDKKGNYLEIEYSSEFLIHQFENNTMQILNIIGAGRGIDEVLDISPFTDLETMRIVIELLAIKVIKVVIR